MFSGVDINGVITYERMNESTSSDLVISDKLKHIERALPESDRKGTR